MDVNRRRLVKGLAAAGATTLTPDLLVGQGSRAPDTDVPRRPMGKTGLHVSVIGLGGFHLGSAKDQGTANDIVAHAIDAGVNFFDNAWDYHDVLSETRLGEALQGKRDKVILMTKVCAHGRDARVAMQMLEESLRRLRTDHLDVWQIHEVIYDNDPDLIFAPGRAAEDLLQAKQQGKVRFVGFSGHKDPAIHLRMLAHDFPFDTIQMPLNCLDATFRSFEQRVLPEANRRGLAVFGMKSFGGGGEIVKYGAATPDEALRYAMSLPVSTTISGIESPDVLTQNLSIATKFSPMTAEEMRVLRERCRPLAADGRFELFKTTKMYDGAVGRAQHHFPTTEKLPA